MSSQTEVLILALPLSSGTKTSNLLHVQWENHYNDVTCL